MDEQTATAPVAAALGPRLGALALDWVIVAAAQVALAMVIQLVSGQPQAGAWLMTGGLLAVVYRAVLHSRHFGGATLGKRALGLCVVVDGPEGVPPSFERATLRAVVRVAPAWAGAFVVLPTDDPGDFVGLATRAATAGALIVALETVTFALVLFDTEGRRALHDLLASTRVVRAEAVPAPPAAPIRGRALVLAALVSLVFAAGWHQAFSGMATLMREHYVQLGGAQRRIEALDCVHLARATKLTMAQRPSVSVVVQLEADCPAPGIAERAVDIVLDEEPGLAEETPLSVVVHDVGRAPSSFADLREGFHMDERSVGEWRESLQGD